MIEIEQHLLPYMRRSIAEMDGTPSAVIFFSEEATKKYAVELYQLIERVLPNVRFKEYGYSAGVSGSVAVVSEVIPPGRLPAPAKEKSDD